MRDIILYFLGVMLMALAFMVLNITITDKLHGESGQNALIVIVLCTIGIILVAGFTKPPEK
jgi:hypothetical protein